MDGNSPSDGRGQKDAPEEAEKNPAESPGGGIESQVKASDPKSSEVGAPDRGGGSDKVDDSGKDPDRAGSQGSQKSRGSPTFWRRNFLICHL